MESSDKVDNEAVTGPFRLSRRQIFQAVGLVGLLEFAAACSRSSSVAVETTTSNAAGSGHVIFTDHQFLVVEAATARLIPGPNDDPAEMGHPGAREAGVANYIDRMLGALTTHPAQIYGGGPFSDRNGASGDDMAEFIALTPAQHRGWSRRLARLRSQYAAGVEALDRAAGGDFASAAPAVQDRVLAKNPGGFARLLFSHAIEGMYSVPEYGGNAGQVGWTDIGFPGDVQPVGYSPAQVSTSDGPDAYEPTVLARQVLSLVQAG
jgi:Gluconate 2-dehydrogenase subunit 3